MQPTTQFLFVLIRAGEWSALCSYYREYLTQHCPRYNRREREERVASWVSRMIVVASQCEEREALGMFGAVRWDSRETLAELTREIDNHWASVLPTYQRTCQSIDTAPDAELAVAEVLKRIESRKISGPQTDRIDATLRRVFRPSQA